MPDFKYNDKNNTNNDKIENFDLKKLFSLICYAANDLFFVSPSWLLFLVGIFEIFRSER